VTFLDVGQGDAILTQAPEGRTALIDAGPGPSVAPALRQLGVESLDLLVATHPHADHIGGMVDVIESMPVRYFLDNGQPHPTATYERLLDALTRHPEIAYLEAIPRTIALGDVAIAVLPLPPAEFTEQNDNSVALVVRYGGFSAFLSGDSQRGEVTYLTRIGAVPDVTLLKAPHHGSDNGFTPAFLAAARPEVVVISVGNNNYGHPGPEAMSAYASVAERVLRTDLDGAIAVLGHEDGGFDVVAAPLRVPSVSGGPTPRLSRAHSRPSARRGLCRSTSSRMLPATTIGTRTASAP
jgi:beta-lactamase superfamily II metal-dependent hydrolase